MYYHEFQNLRKEYRPKIKMIRSKTYHKRLKYNDGTDKYGPCDLFEQLWFAKTGILQGLHRTHYTKQWQNKNHSYFQFTYFKKGKPAVITQFDPGSRQFQNETKFAYFEDGRIRKEERYYHPENKQELCLRSEIHHSYYHHIHVESMYNGIFGKHGNYTIKRTLDEHNNVIELSKFNGNGSEMTTNKLIYKNNHQLIGITNKDSTSAIFYYYEHNEISKWEKYETYNGNEWKATRTFNEHGHWIKELVKKNGAIHRVCLRKIEYYD